MAGGNPELINRIAFKNETLKQLKELGVWLVDASPFALYSSNNDIDLRPYYREVLNLCWNLLIREQIEDANPNDIMVIGHNVYNALSENLTSLFQDRGINIFNFFQPQAHIAAEMHLMQFQEYYRNCHQE